ncbi:MAG: OB-fold nucleic acid binding domain-containing protein, partial [Candidatus Bathyarchaeota archaeon]
EYPIQDFTRSNGSTGKLKKISIGDQTGTIDVVLWGEKADTVAAKNIKPNVIAKIVHGYSAESFNGKAELHIGSRGEINLLSPEEGNDYPPVSHFFSKITELRNKDEVNVNGAIVRILPVKTFERAERVGKVMRLRIVDETGEVDVVVWDDQVESVKNLKRGDSIQLMKGKIKENTIGEPEIHVGKRSQLCLLGKVSPP